MRIRGSSITSTSPPPPPSPHLSSYSTFSTHYLTSYTRTESSSLNSSSSSIDYYSRCEGLDLLVKAVVHVAGSFFLGVPFTQRRVIRRRKKASKFRNSSVDEFNKKEEEEENSKKKVGFEVIPKPKKRKRVMALPSKYHDSVLQTWKRRSRGNRSIDIN